jgi:hypothetical protein
VRAGKELLYPVGEITRFDEELLAEARDRAIARNPSRAALQVLPGQEDATVLPITRTRGKRQRLIATSATRRSRPAPRAGPAG